MLTPLRTYPLAEHPLETLRGNMRFICQYILKHDRPPSSREMMQPFGVRSVNTVEYRLRVLRSKGYISVERGISRGVSPTARGIAAAGLDHSWPLRLLPLDIQPLRWAAPRGSVAAYVDTKGYGRIFYMMDRDILAEATP